MSLQYEQKKRLISIETPLGKDVLLLKGLSGQEEISRLFSIHVDLASTREFIDPTEIVGRNVDLKFEDDHGAVVYRNGHIRSFVNRGRDDRLTNYQAEVVPWLWFLTRNQDCRIFQEKTVPQILEEVFATHGFTHFENAGLRASYEKLEYCVQYRETDFDFVSRLMEEVGIFYYFTHEKGRHVVVLGDGPHAYGTCSKSRVSYRGLESFTETDDDLLSWEHTYEFRSGRIAHADFDFKKPPRPMVSKERSVIKVTDVSKYELYDYPARFVEVADGEQRARWRMEEEEAPHDVVRSSSKAIGLQSGHKFTVDRHQSQAEKGKTLLVTALRMEANAGDYVTGSEPRVPFENSFECVPASITWRPRRTTPKSLVHGPQTAIVVGPSGEEIYTDELGRVKVQFHWDRYGQSDEKSSCWIRVSQNWAGKDYGGFALPRIGQEVVVDFLEGDPDRPLITGRVYNVDQTTPQSLPEPEATWPAGAEPISAMQGRESKLPEAKTRTSMKSHSTPKGSEENEITFDDKAESELFYVHASKDWVRTVNNDETTKVGNDQRVSVDANQQHYVGKDRWRHVEKNEDCRVVGDRKEIVQGKTHLVVESDKLELVQADKHTHVKGEHKEKVVGKTSLATKELHQKADKAIAAEAGMEIHLKAGMKVVIEAMEVTLKGAGGFVKVDPMGVSISGNLVMINSGGAPGAGSGAKPTAPEDAEEAK